jgi:hypothetical protein
MAFDLYEAWVGGVQLTCIEKAMASQDRRDVLDCARYFQLFASGKADIATQPTLWFDKYEEVMKNFGWRVLESGSQVHRPLQFNLGQTLGEFDTGGPVANFSGVQALLAQQWCHDPAPALGQWAVQTVVGGSTAGPFQVAMVLGNAHGASRLDVMLIQFTLNLEAACHLLTHTFSALQGEVSIRWFCGEPHPLLFPRFKPVVQQRLAHRLDQVAVRIELPCTGGSHV